MNHHTPQAIAQAIKTSKPSNQSLSYSHRKISLAQAISPSTTTSHCSPSMWCTYKWYFKTIQPIPILLFTGIHTIPSSLNYP
nr:hypothetical protein Q903MT_gene1083 [Picea sitchensis]